MYLYVYKSCSKGSEEHRSPYHQPHLLISAEISKCFDFTLEAYYLKLSYHAKLNEFSLCQEQS